MKGMEATADRTAASDLREVQHCPQCGSPLIASPILTCAHCGKDVALRCFLYRRKPGFIAECIDLDLLSQGNTPEEAIARLQEAMFSYLDVAFEGKCVLGLVPRPSPFSHRARYYWRR